MVKDPPANAGDRRDLGSVPGFGRRHCNPHSNSGLENPVDSGAWWARVHEVSKESDMIEVT